MPDEKPLTVFISYSRETDLHVRWVRQLADRLEQCAEFRVILDQYDLHPGMDLNHFMNTALTCDRVVVVITQTYVQKAATRTGGVGYESGVISADLLESQLQDRFVPVLRAGSARPPFLRSKLYVDFRNEHNFERGLDDLRRALLRIPEASRPAKLHLASAASAAPPKIAISETPATSYREDRDPDFTAGLRHFRERRFVAALSNFRSVVKRYPNSSDGRYYLVLCALSGRRPKLLRSDLVAEIDSQLGEALAGARDGAPHIRYLWAILRHDCYILNGLREPTPTAEELLQTGVLLPNNRASELASTISAPGNPVWDVIQQAHTVASVREEVVDGR